VSDPRVLLVVPTLGQRLDTLAESLESIASQSVPADVIVVAPDSSALRAVCSAAGAAWLADPGSQASAINAGIRTAAARHEFVGWLNDDDLLELDSLTATVGALDSDSAAVVAYGACRYIDQQGRELWISRAGSWAPRILKWGPDLIPQPGMLVRRRDWEAVGGVDERMRFAFDLDLLLRLQPRGSFRDVGQVVSAFRWHADSLTVADRTRSLEESEAAKRRALSPRARRLAWLWERPVRLATRVAAAEVSRRARRKASALGS
jgi:GT2 family glycosyltransferase